MLVKDPEKHCFVKYIKAEHFEINVATFWVINCCCLGEHGEEDDEQTS